MRTGGHASPRRPAVDPVLPPLLDGEVCLTVPVEHQRGGMTPSGAGDSRVTAG